MRVSQTVVIGLCVASAIVFPAAIEAQLLTQRNMSLAVAKVIADAAIAACVKEGTNVSAAVVDRAGALVILQRSDAANPHNAELARRKAYTSRTFGITTLQFRENTKGDSIFAGQRMLADVIPLGGGVPIRVGNELIGAVGLSGSPQQEVDEKCALAGIAAAGDFLK